MRDPVAMSVRDLVLLMLTVSDNAACDVLYDLVGSDAVAAVPSALGLRATTVRGAARDFLGSIPTDLGVEPREVASALTSPGALERLSVLDPAGEAFNPDHHQAISQVQAEGVAADTVAQVFQKGYLLNGRLLRPALVVVAS